MSNLHTEERSNCKCAFEHERIFKIKLFVPYKFLYRKMKRLVDFTYIYPTDTIRFMKDLINAAGVVFTKVPNVQNI